jgi:hypothetical protein
MPGSFKASLITKRKGESERIRTKHLSRPTLYG